MKLRVIIDFSADGFESEEEELAAFKQLIEDCDSSGVSIKVLKVEQLPDDE